MQDSDPVFMQELAHYEWVDLALDVADENIDCLHSDPKGDLLTALPQVSPLAWSLTYQFPVHKIGPEFQPVQPGEQPTFLIVYRNREDKVQFMEANSVTARLLELLRAEEAVSGQQVLEQIAQDIQHPDPQQVVVGGLAILQQLHSLDIILGAK